MVRGLALTRDDLVRRAVIMALMCQGQARVRVDRAGAPDRLPRATSRPNSSAWRELGEQGLVVLEPDGVEVTPIGWYFVRAVAMVFDQPLQSDRARERYSRII